MPTNIQPILRLTDPVFRGEIPPPIKKPKNSKRPAPTRTIAPTSIEATLAHLEKMKREKRLDDDWEERAAKEDEALLRRSGVVVGEEGSVSGESEVPTISGFGKPGTKKAFR
ncbi:hypothetical protein HK097_000412, partial [Rhizophlyctis rosea]